MRIRDTVHTRTCITLTGVALAGAWIGLALSLSTILGLPIDSARPASSGPIEQRSWTTRLEVTGSDPCTNDLVAVGATLTLDVVRRTGGGQHSVDVDVRLDAQANGLYGDLVAPLALQYAPYQTPIGGVPFVHTVRTPLVGRRGLDLVVDLQGAVDDRGETSLSIGGSRLDTRRSPCSTAPVGAPGAPVTRHAQATLPA